MVTAAKELLGAVSAEETETRLCFKELKVLANIKSAAKEQSAPKVQAAVRELGMVERDFHVTSELIFKQLERLAKLFPQSTETFLGLLKNIKERFEWIDSIIDVRKGTLISLASAESPDFVEINKEAHRVIMYVTSILEQLEIGKKETADVRSFGTAYHGKLRCVNCASWIDGGITNFSVLYWCPRCVKWQRHNYTDYVSALTKKKWAMLPNLRDGPGAAAPQLAAVPAPAAVPVAKLVDEVVALVESAVEGGGRRRCLKCGNESMNIGWDHENNNINIGMRCKKCGLRKGGTVNANQLRAWLES